MGNDHQRRGDLDDPDAFVTTWAIRDALHTRVHARMFFDMVVAKLGESAWVETWNGGKERLVFVREEPGSSLVIPWPLVTFSTIAQVTFAWGDADSVLPPPRPGRVPKLRNLGPGRIEVHDGRQSVTVVYGDDGRWRECTRGGPKDVHAGVPAALATATAQPAELVADYLVALDAARHGPGRVCLPAPMPGGVRGTWNCALFALRAALFDGRIPRRAQWAVADSVVGKAVASGAKRDEALAAWRQEVERVRPVPPRPTVRPEDLPEPQVETSSDPVLGTFSASMVLRGPTSDVELPAITATTTPYAIVPLAHLPREEPPIGSWVRLLDDTGKTGLAALIRDDDGFTLVEERALAALDLPELDRQVALAEIDEASRPTSPVQPPPGFPRPPRPDSVVRAFTTIDPRTGERCALTPAWRSRGKGFDPATLDAARLRGCIVRQRRLPD